MLHATFILDNQEEFNCSGCGCLVRVGDSMIETDDGRRFHSVACLEEEKQEAAK